MLETILVPVDSIEWDNTLRGVENAIEFARGCRIDGEPELIFVHVFSLESGVPMSEKERLKEMKRKKWKMNLKRSKKCVKKKE